MSQLETAMGMLRSIFDKYAGEDGVLNKAEFKRLFAKEMPAYMKEMADDKGVLTVMKDLDKNGDGQVDFNEFMQTVSDVTCTSHKNSGQ